MNAEQKNRIEVLKTRMLEQPRYVSIEQAFNHHKNLSRA